MKAYTGMGYVKNIEAGGVTFTGMGYTESQYAEYERIELTSLVDDGQIDLESGFVDQQIDVTSEVDDGNIEATSNIDSQVEVNSQIIPPETLP